ncbi:hypothetical protein JOC78_001354 [Bacillus ectoiniformans]|uniref:hypothetical protein n=1 Tax=Bacillus ectoiniformans TaxID=1494429 RepID=UPI00195A54D9|nr:hypothetical protein [Bacillus ectoiniformans]MBM7648412.1 hypothetical protein [Bacillus ectoiniformans]
MKKIKIVVGATPMGAYQVHLLNEGNVPKENKVCNSLSETVNMVEYLKDEYEQLGYMIELRGIQI